MASLPAGAPTPEAERPWVPPRAGGPGFAPAGVFSEMGPALYAALRSADPHKLVLQVPAGLVRDARRLAGELEREVGARVVVQARACFGGCDGPDPSEAPGTDAAVVLGHSPIPNVRLPMPTYFVEMRRPDSADPERLARIVREAGLPLRLGLVASVQHLDLIPQLQDALASGGYTLLVGEGDRRLAHPGQALGCNYTGAEAIRSQVDAYLFLGTGRFHPLGLAYAVDAPVWSLDPLSGELEPPIDRERLIAKRLLTVAQVRDARRWGILVSSFAGQDRSPMAEALRRKAEAHGREAEVLVFGRLDPRDLEGRDLDAYVNTACPRIALDDSDLYPKPVLTPPEFLVAIGERPMTPYLFDTYH